VRITFKRVVQDRGKDFIIMTFEFLSGIFGSKLPLGGDILFVAFFNEAKCLPLEITAFNSAICSSLG